MQAVCGFGECRINARRRQQNRYKRCKWKMECSHIDPAKVGEQQVAGR